MKLQQYEDVSSSTHGTYHMCLLSLLRLTLYSVPYMDLKLLSSLTQHITLAFSWHSTRLSTPSHCLSFPALLSFPTHPHPPRTLRHTWTSCTASPRVTRTPQTCVSSGCNIWQRSTFNTRTTQRQQCASHTQWHWWQSTSTFWSGRAICLWGVSPSRWVCLLNGCSFVASLSFHCEFYCTMYCS